VDANPGAGLRLLTFTTLYPNTAQPTHGVFVENRLRHLVETGLVRSTVLAPVPFFPSGHQRFGAWARYARVPASECRHGLAIYHPRWLSIPRFGMSVAPALLFASAVPVMRALQRRGRRFDAIDAHYLYPDGIAAVQLGRAFGVPVIVTARGSDVTELPNHTVPRRWITWALAQADALIGVSAALSARLVALGADPAKVTTLRNGVDTSLFTPPVDRVATRAALGLHGPTLLSVGHLITRKGHDRVIAALMDLPENVVLLIAGEGPLQAELERQAARLGLAARVRFLGSIPHECLAAVYGAADVLVLASSREGWANVLLEAMASGTPVVASPIPGNDEVVASSDAGHLAPANTPAGIASAVMALLADPPSRAATRAYAERFGWDETSRGQIEVFQRVLRVRSANGATFGQVA
jgi:teichuronic acid biosynthesis glycosyltransferase TuaC